MLDSGESLTHKLLRKGFWLYFLAALSAPLGYFIRVIIARDLTLADFGILYGVMALITLLWSYNDLGFTEALNYYLPKRAVIKDWTGVTRLSAYALLVQAGSSVAMAAVLWYAAPSIAGWLFRDESAVQLIRVYTLFLVGHGLFQVPVTIFAALQDVKAQKSIDLVRLAATLAFVVSLWQYGAGSSLTYAWAWIAGVGVATAIAWILAFLRLRPFFDRRGLTWNAQDFFPVMRYAVWSVLAANVGTLLSQLDTLFVIYFLGNATNGIYSNYLSLMGLPFLVIGPAVSFLFPVFSELFARGDAGKISLLKRAAYGHLSALSFYFGSFFVALGPSLAAFFFGEKFADSGAVMAWSGPFLVFNFLLQVNFMLLAGTGRARIRMLLLLAGLGLNLATLSVFLVGVPFLGIPGIGLPGAALASGLGWILIFFLSHHVTRAYPAGVNWTRLLSNLVAAGALGAVGYWAFGGSSFGNGWALFAALAAGGALHILAWALINLRDLREVADQVRSLRNPRRAPEQHPPSVLPD